MLILAALLAIVTADDPFPGRYLEPIEASQPIRQKEFDQIEAYANALKNCATSERDKAFQPDYSSLHAFTISTLPLQRQIRERIGFPPPLIKRCATPRIEHLADDAYASIFRVWIEVLDGVEAYGILSIPHGLTGPAPLLICQHGGGGNPELIQAMPSGDGGGATNYGWMVQRALKEGYVTYAPALIFNYAGKEAITGPTRVKMDEELRYVGTSILAVELWKIIRGIDVASSRPEVDRSRIGMMGLSYGGLYTLYATALDPRIKVAVSSCFFNERIRYAWQDWSFFNYYNEFNDAEVCALICPRPFMVEAGDKDPLFAVDGARAEAIRAGRHWTNLGLGDRFVLDVFEGGHEFKGDKAYDFVRPYLKPVAPFRK